jgi:hypothetical protein
MPEQTEDHLAGGGTGGVAPAQAVLLPLELVVVDDQGALRMDPDELPGAAQVEEVIRIEDDESGFGGKGLLIPPLPGKDACLIDEGILGGRRIRIENQELFPQAE